MPRAAPQDLDPLYVEEQQLAEELRDPRSAGRIPVALLPEGPERPRPMGLRATRVHPSLCGSLPPAESSRWMSSRHWQAPSAREELQRLERSPAVGDFPASPRCGFVVPTASDFSSAGETSGLTVEQEQQLEFEIRLLEQQMARPDSPPQQPEEVLPILQREAYVPGQVQRRKEPKPEPVGFFSEYAHLTRSEYIKLKTQRRSAALAIQTRVKIFLLRRSLLVAWRVPAARRIQGCCYTFLAKVKMLDKEKNAKLRFVLALTHFQAKVRRFIKRKQEERQRLADEEARRWQEKLRRVQIEGACKVQAKCRSFLAMDRMQFDGTPPRGLGRLGLARGILQEARARGHADPESMPSSPQSFGGAASERGRQRAGADEAASGDALADPVVPGHHL
eukprot:g30103.t1